MCCDAYLKQSLLVCLFIWHDLYHSPPLGWCYTIDSCLSGEPWWNCGLSALSKGGHKPPGKGGEVQHIPLHIAVVVECCNTICSVVASTTGCTAQGKCEPMCCWVNQFSETTLLVLLSFTPLKSHVFNHSIGQAFVIFTPKFCSCTYITILTLFSNILDQSDCYWWPISVLVI